MKLSGLSKKLQKRLKITLGLLVGFVVFTILTMTVDVSTGGVEGTKIGFSTMNLLGAQVFSYNEFWYKVSELAGYATLLVAASFAMLGLYQLIKRKSLMKVDLDIFVLGAFYLIVLLLYVLFDGLAINYRPVMIEGLEPSYPSSHTMLAICILLSATSQLKMRIKNIRVRSILTNLCIVLMVIVVCSRLLSGVHWVSDIMGGILISSALVMMYESTIQLINELSK